MGKRGGRGDINTSCENHVANTIQNYVPDINYPSSRNIATENQPWLPFRRLAERNQRSVVIRTVDLGG